MDHLDHISNRITVASLSGLVIGASVATYKALPLPRTTLSIAASFALTSTACLIPERIIHQCSFYFFELTDSSVGTSNSNTRSDNNNEKMKLGGILEDKERRRLIGSHIGGGIIGGTISGSLFQKRLSLNGMALFTPIMIGVAFLEFYLEDYKKQRLKEIANSSQQQ